MPNKQESTTPDVEGKKQTWNPCEQDHKWCDPINESDILYRTQYLVLSRTLLEAMPKKWQHKFVDLIDDIGDEFDFMHEDWVTPSYTVRAKDNKKRFIQDPWGTYRYPNTGLIEKVRKNNHDK